jgi:CheY-like chemotaxis protein
MILNKSLLLLEDDIVDVMTFKRALKQLDLSNELVVEENGTDGLEYLLNCKDLPGLIFLDINMPKMNGIEFLDVLRKNEEWALIPVIVLTTSKNKEDKLVTFRNGISSYMIKPVDYPQFKDMIETIIKYWTYSEHAY